MNELTPADRTTIRDLVRRAGMLDVLRCVASEGEVRANLAHAREDKVGGAQLGREAQLVQDTIESIRRMRA